MYTFDHATLFDRFQGPRPEPRLFRWLPEKVQCLLILLLTLPVTVLFFMAGMHCVHDQFNLLQ